MFLLSIGSLVLGVLLMIAYNVVAPAYFRGEVLNASTPPQSQTSTDPPR